MAAVQKGRIGGVASAGHRRAPSGTAERKIGYRACSTLDDFRECVRLQKEVWRFDDLEVLPSDAFVAVLESGGQIFGAFEASGRGPSRESKMAGFLVAMPGIRNGVLFFHSHMLGVLPEHRNCGVGRRLKMMQRDDALTRGVRLIEWTFDPLELKNAFFNIARLGAIVRRYVPNCYGMTTSDLHGGLPTDRLVAEWWIESGRVRTTLEGRQHQAAIERRIEVPADITDIKKRDRARALEIQARIRTEFQRAFAAGLVVAGVDAKGAYLLSREEALGDARLRA